MYFVCPSCQAALRVPPGKLPERRVRYTCKRCGTASVVQDHLADRPPGQPPAPPDADPDLDGTVYHHVNDLARFGDARFTYEFVCGVKTLDGPVRKLTVRADRFTVGRGDADVRVDDPLVSRVHVEIERVLDRVLLKDLESTNGTFVNDRRVSAEFLTEGDVVRVGNTRLKVRLVAR